MAWCPKCKCEYTPGITHCPDCDVDLVDTLEPDVSSIEETEQDLWGEMDASPDASAEYEYEKDEFNENPLKNQEYVHAFVESSAREVEMKSSGISFLVVGILLLAVAVLIYIDVIPFGATTGQRLMNTGIITIFSIVFLTVAFISYRRAKQLSVSSKQEEKLTEEIIEFCLKNYEEPVTEEIQEEEVYFIRESYLRELISSEFKGLSESYLDYLLDIIYNELYPSAE